jgi:hypothetical protein
LTKVGSHIKHHQCQNCGTALPNLEEFCPNCGQLNHDLKIPLRHLFLEILESTFHFETSFWITLKNLLFFPGKITKEFNAGKRATYMNPFRMYVFVSLIFFILLGKLTNSSKDEQIAEKLKTLNDFKIKQREFDSIKLATKNFDPRLMDSIAVANDTRNEKIMDSIYKLNSDDYQVLKIQKKIIQFKYAIDDTIGIVKRQKEISDSALPINLKPKKLSEDEIGVLAAEIISDSRIDGDNLFYQSIDTLPPFTYEDMIKMHGYSSEAYDSLIKLRPRLNPEEKGTFTHYITLVGLKINAKQVFYNDKNYLMNSTFKSISLSMFFIMPLFGFMLRLFYLRRNAFYYETLVFSIHFHTFTFIVFSIFFLLKIIFKDHFNSTLFLIPVGLMLLYLFLSLKKVFKQGYIKSLIKEILIIFSYSIVLTIIVVLVGFITYAN